MSKVKIVEAKAITHISVIEKNNILSKNRKAKQNTTTNTQQRKNDRKKVEHQILLAYNNFSDSDSAWFTLTFSDVNGCPTIEEAEKHFENFRKGLKRLLPNVCYCAVLHLGSKNKRPHYHIIITLQNRETIATLWKYGYVYASSLCTDSLIKLIKYLYRGAYYKRNRRTFINSRNLIKPAVIVYDGEYYEEYRDIIGKAIGVDETKVHDVIEGDSPLTWRYTKAFIESSVYNQLIDTDSYCLRQNIIKLGEQAHMDWGIAYYTDKMGKIHKTSVFTMALGNSRSKYVEFTKRCDLPSLIKCMMNAFEYYGGAPEIVLTNKMRTIIEGIEAKKPMLNSRFEAFAFDMGFMPIVYRVRRFQTKGKVKRPVNYVKDSFLSGRQFNNLHDLNIQALEWSKIIDSKTHRTTQGIPLEALKREPLQPLPHKAILDQYRQEARKVTRNGFVSYDGVKYGVPREYRGRKVGVRICGDFIEVYYDGLRIARHKSEYLSGKIVRLRSPRQVLAEKGGIVISFPFVKKKETEAKK